MCKITGSPGLWLAGLRLARQMTLPRSQTPPWSTLGGLLVGTSAVLAERIGMGMEVFTKRRRAPRRKGRVWLGREVSHFIDAAPAAQRGGGGPGIKRGFSDCPVPGPHPSAGWMRVLGPYLSRMVHLAAPRVPAKWHTHILPFHPGPPYHHLSFTVEEALVCAD